MLRLTTTATYWLGITLREVIGWVDAVHLAPGQVIQTPDG